MLKRTISLSLLCMASHAYSANIIVTTTADEDGSNPNACSLREAIQLINGESVPDPENPSQKIYKDLLNSTKGFGGCGGKDAVSDVFYTTVVELPFGKTYSLEREIQIKRALTLRSDDSDNSRDRLGVNNPVIRAVGAHRLFDINDENLAATSVQSVLIQQVNLEGCAITDANRVCATNGGIISNNESLLLSMLRVKGGRAGQLGGAVFSTTPQSSLSMINVDMQQNVAESGAALSFEQPNFSISRSYFSNNNVAANSAGAVLHVRDGLQQTNSSGALVPIVTIRSGRIADSTFYQNNAAVIDLREGIVINNSTLVDNRAGVRFVASRGGSNVANSIVAGNSQFDCQFSAGDQSYLNNNVFISGCDQTLSTLHAAQTKIANSATDNTTLFAAQVDGQCARPPALGLLCRPAPVATTLPELQDGTEVFNPYLRPRLLTQYQSLNESKIVNKGRSISAVQQALTCTPNDQRGFERTLCDIGAVELVIDNNRKTNGLDIRFGGIAALNLAPLLGDGDLIPAAVCPDIFPTRQPDSGGWLEGCLTYVKAPQKGVLTLEPNGQITYRPSSNFHGVDRFNYDVVTTTSRFSQGANDQKINIETTIVQEPVGSDTDRKVNLAGGSFGWVGLFSLFGLAVAARRNTKKRTTKQQGAC